MKTAISIPDPLFEAAEEFAKRMGLSRSQLYAVALQEYLQEHKRDQITKQLDVVYADEDSSLDPLFVRLQAHTISEENW
ncbi:putative transcriptional regulator with CopG/Arc/MetJ DNA-binding domain and metal-binding domain [Cylindrospermum stagnale PCC 7417]|uniref:Putative transcriptional regulator with CopG/Arc/MetJ DNA-binding domain and metal-binding domain n=1 Tax=Cylindrospermum stagnale PCC 7417 TaxID=56107 RepID=K9WV15_9NOST|nr:CopG family transcriptional regulator [Cylindrospermum stagnale]AFZ24225.1 putative transcriptional regulator with CopG/Arc/MetJ DNA-binding domain and metal-binding domain [Cylindrospermum stagnale PCC 7417]